MKKKIAIVLALAMALSMALAGCGGTPAASPSASSGTNTPAPSASATESASSGQTVTLDVMHRFADEPYKSTFEDLLAQYKEAHPNIDFNITFTATDPYLEKLNILMSSDDPPDVFFSFAGEFLNKYIREGLVYDLADEYNSNPDWQAAWNPKLIQPFWTDDGHLYGLDYDLTIKLFFYNIDIFNKYNLKVPQTWDELLNVCKTLKDNGVLPLSEGDSDQWPATHLLAILFHDLVPEDVRKQDYNPKTGEWTDPSYVKAMEYYRQLVQYMNDDVVSITHSVARMSFAQGESAMAYLESIEMSDVEKDSEGKLNFGMFKFPKIEGAPGNQDMLLGSPEGFSMSAKTLYPEESKDLMFWITGKEAGKQIIEKNSWFNAAIGTLDVNTASQKLVDCYNLLMGCDGLVNWIDNECHTLLRDVFYSRTQDWINGTISNEEYIGLIRAAAQEAKKEVGG